MNATFTAKKTKKNSNSWMH